MAVSPDQEMAYKLTELYLKHIMHSRDRKELSLDDIVDKYHYVLDEIKSKSGTYSEETIQENMSLLPGIPDAPIEYQTETNSDILELSEETKEDGEDISASDLL